MRQEERLRWIAQVGEDFRRAMEAGAAAQQKLNVELRKIKQAQEAERRRRVS